MTRNVDCFKILQCPQFSNLKFLPGPLKFPKHTERKHLDNKLSDMSLEKVTSLYELFYPHLKSRLYQSENSYPSSKSHNYLVYQTQTKDPYLPTKISYQKAPFGALLYYEPTLPQTPCRLK